MSAQAAKRKPHKPLVLTIASGDASKAQQRRGSLVSPPSSTASPFSAGYCPGGPGNNSLAHSCRDGQISETFYQLVVSKPALDYSAFANVLKLLLQDSSSISGLMKKESTRAPFILGFQEQAKSIVDFFTKLSPYIKQNPGQYVVLAKALLEGLLIPLFVEEYEDIFAQDEMLELITVALRSYYDGGTYSAPGLVTQLVSKLTLFPDTNLLERFIAQLCSGELFGAIVKDQKYGSSLFEHGHSILVTWIDRLLKLSSHCEFDHGISAYQAQWEALTSLNSIYPQLTALGPSTEGFQTQKKGGMKNLRKLTEQDKKSGGSRRASADSERITVPQEAVKHFQALNSPIPKTLSAARNAVRQLELTMAFRIFEGILQSFPCSNCCKSPVKGGPVVGQPGTYWDDPNATNRPDIEECRVGGEQVYRMELKNLGLWRIVLSRQAMKDFSDARKFGHFAAVESKLRELATGNWDQRRALTKKHINPEFPIPIKKAVYGDNGRIIWHVHLSFDATMDQASQVILVWRIGDHKEVVQSESVILRHQKTFRSEFIHACKVRAKDANGTYQPKTFGTDLLDEEQICGTLTREESLDLHNAVITGKFYTLTQTVLDGILASGSSAEFPFDVAHDEVEIIRQTSAASFILGRSGTGKTTCLAFKLLSSYIGSRANMEGGLSPDARPVRQVFITRSEILAQKLNGYIRRLISCQLGRFESDDIDSIGMEVLKEKDEESEARDLWSLTDSDFPLVCTFDKLLAMVERSIKKGGRKFWDHTMPESPTAARGNYNTDSTRVPREVDAQIFIDHYWSKIPGGTKGIIPVDLVFSEIMGIIKGSASGLPGRSLKSLTREEYLNKSCRVAPLFTSEAERKQVYMIYESYEKLKGKYRDWDGVDRTREVLLQMRETPALVSRLRDVIEEIYVDEIQDQRLLEIEFLLGLVKYPRGVHLAGDSAQCISRDSTFRFSDIKALFFDVFDRTATAMNNNSLSKPKEFRLAHNYRSHQGIIALGALLIESLWNGFPDMIDKLRPEIGKYTGPKPTFFAGFRAEDVLASQAFGVVDLYDQLADFGADQVILVRDEDVQKEIHSRVGSEVLILTVLQSKGMEFEDVVLLNFFSSGGYTNSYRSLEKLIDRNFGEFDRKKHSILCAELKTLYVAVTRCRANLRIVEENKNIAEIIVDLWTKKVPEPLIETVHPGDTDARAKIKALRSGSSGNPALWLKNGQHLMDKKLYKQALFCFLKTPHKQRQLHARAYVRRQDAETLALQNLPTTREEAKKLYRESAALFLEADHPMEASRSLEAAGLWEEAAEMWMSRQKPEKAAPLYERGGKHSKASKTYHMAAMYTEATKTLRSGELYEELVDYLETVKDTLEPIQYQRSSKLCNLLAHQGKLKPAYKTRTLRLLGSELKIELFYRQRGYTNELLELFRSSGRTKDAFHYLTSLGKVKEAVLLAPFEEMKASIPTVELNRMQQLLLISDIRSTQDGKAPVYADLAHPHARPGMDLLWGALYRALKTWTRVENLTVPSDSSIDGFPGTIPYMDIIVLERIGEVLDRARDLSMLPYPSINKSLQLLRDLYFAKDHQVPDILRRFVGAYHQPNRTSLLLLSTSLLNTTSKTHRQVSREQLSQLCTSWFANLVIKSTMAYLDKANRIWNNARSGNQCVRFVTTGHCSTPPGSRLLRCPHNHQVLSSEGFGKLCQIVQDNALVTSKLRFFYSSSQLRPVLDDIFYESFRPRQRRWQESLLAELTFISAVQQDPVLIHSAAVFHSHQEKYKPYRWLCDDIGMLLQDIHAKDEWNSRSTFSGLLELSERAEKLGPRISRAVRMTVLKQITNTLRDRRVEGPRKTTLLLFRDRPRIEHTYQKNYWLKNLETYFSKIGLLAMSELSSLHSVLSHYERIATYLLMLEGDQSEFLILTSWITLHLREVGPAYCKLLLDNMKLNSKELFPNWVVAARERRTPEFKAAICSCLLNLAWHSMVLVDRVIKDTTTKFKLGGERGAGTSKDLLIRRCFDIACICIFNLHTTASLPPQWNQFWSEFSNYYLPTTTSYLGISLPPYPVKEVFFKAIASTFSIYAGKESITFVQSNPRCNRFASYRGYFTQLQIPSLILEEIDPVKHFDMQEATEEESGEQTFTSKEQAAAEVICRIWRQYWPRYKQRKEWRNTPLGRSTTATEEICRKYQQVFSILPEIYQELHIVFWLHGPKTYEAIQIAEVQGAEVSERYQAFFTSLYGTSYTDEDLERVEEYFEEVERYIDKVASMKSTFSVDGVRALYFSYADLRPETAAVRLRDYMAAMQKEAVSIRHSFNRLIRNKYVENIQM
ncbi:hypothetical protein EV426DRAFT_566796 [Tirmania nivea]|nr:hypothetical protein EV426DRAFT_566796 [Tirmania nivea]